MNPEENAKQQLKKLEPAIGIQACKALWLSLIASKDWQRKQAMLRRISVLAEASVGLYEDKTLLPPPRLQGGEIKIGTVEYNGKPVQEFSITKQSLIRHASVFGKTGSGKTNLAFSLITQLAEQGIPFMVFDWKRNFRDMLRIPGMKDKLRIFTVGRDVSPFRFNPKSEPKNCDAEAYQKKLCEIIEWAYFLGLGAHDIIMEAYDKGDFRQMGEWLEKQHKRGREMLWWASGKRTLTSINWGGLGRMVNHPQPYNMKNLLKQGVVLELDGLTEADKSFVVGSIMNWVMEFRRAQQEREVLKHVIIVEEAHHVFRKKADTKPEDLTDTIFREIREYGEALIILDQHPHRTSTQALGNTDIRIAMQTELEKDRLALAGSMLLSREESECLARLTPGLAIAKTGNTERPFLVRIPKFEISKGCVTDYELHRAFHRKLPHTPPTPEE